MYHHPREKQGKQNEQTQDELSIYKEKNKTNRNVQNKTYIELKFSSINEFVNNCLYYNSSNQNIIKPLKTVF